MIKIVIIHFLNTQASLVCCFDLSSVFLHQLITTIKLDQQYNNISISSPSFNFILSLSVRSVRDESKNTGSGR